MEFKVGDTVSFGGAVGTITELVSQDDQRPLCVFFDIGNAWCFTLDGRLLTTHTEPLLKLVERPKKKVKQSIKLWVNVYRDGYLETFWSKEQADIHRSLLGATCVEVTGEYEVEE